MKLSNNAIDWLANGDRGIGSETIFTYLTGVNALGEAWAAHPFDPADFRLCRLLLEKCPELIAEFPRMASVSITWKLLLENWLSLCALMDAEYPRWREAAHTESLPLTNELMKFLGCQLN